MGYTAAMVVIGFNFKEKLNLAAGISVSGMKSFFFFILSI